jgi:hypothetical protein
MRIDPAIAAMRRDPALQRRAQAAMIAAGGEWRQEPAVAAMLDELDSFGAGEPLEACPALDAAFTGRRAAGELAAALCRRFTSMLEEEPLGHPPFRHGFDGHVSTLLLARAGRAQLILHAREPGRWEHATAGYSDALRYEAVLAGSAHARVTRVHGGPGAATFSTESLKLQPGTRVALDLSCEALQVLQVERRLVSLRLHRFDAAPRPSREYSLTDGALLHQSAGDIRASRHEMMVALLGRMERREAAPEIAALAREPGDDSLRWQAMRECLALDTAEGFRALSDVARVAGDPLAGPAGALRAQLVEAHPELLALEDGSCPA